VTVIAGHCEVTIGCDDRNFAISSFAAPALEIARTVGCSPYEDDFALPELPEKLRDWSWTAFPSPPSGDDQTP
jgi:hypothetical protein